MFDKRNLRNQFVAVSLGTYLQKNTKMMKENALYIGPKLIYIHKYYLKLLLLLIQWYVDTDTSGDVELVASERANDLSVRGSGFLILLQDQDSFGWLARAY